MLGLYVSDHPLLGVESQLRALARTSISSLDEAADGTTVTVGGIVAGVSRRYTRNGEPMLYFALEDLEASVEVVCFPRVVAEKGPFVREDAILVVKARVDQRETAQLIALTCRNPTCSGARGPSAGAGGGDVGDLVASLRAISLIIPDRAGIRPLETEGKTTVAHRIAARRRASCRLYADLRALLGADSVLS